MCAPFAVLRIVIASSRLGLIHRNSAKFIIKLRTRINIAISNHVKLPLTSVGIYILRCIFHRANA